MRIENKVRLALSKLGFDLEEVVEELRRWEIRGKRVDAQECPIARYVREMVPEAGRVRAYVDGVVVQGITVDTTEAVKEFIVAFDNGELPEFVEP